MQYLQRIRNFFHLARLFVEHLFEQLKANECAKTAGSLTYTSLFAVVPLLTVVFAVLSIMPSFEDASHQVIELIFSNLIPVGSDTLRTYIIQFAEQARSLTWVGMAILFVASYMMLNNIEKAFNRIWRIRQGRTRISSFLLYWAMMSAGPLLLGIGLAFTTYVKSIHVLQIDGADLLSPLWGLFPFALNTLLLLLLYVAVPNCRIPMSRALVGAVVTAAMFELAKDAFGLVMSVTNYEFIYGTFAVVPLFLIWLWLTWLLILAGAVSIRAMSLYKISHGIDQPKFVVALKILHPIWQRHRQGMTTQWDRLVRTSYVGGAKSLQQWETMRERLIELNILTLTPTGSMTLKRSLKTWKLYELFDGVSGMQHLKSSECYANAPSWEGDLARRLEDARTHFHESMGISVEALFEGEYSDERSSGAS